MKKIYGFHLKFYGMKEETVEAACPSREKVEPLFLLYAN